MDCDCLTTYRKSYIQGQVKNINKKMNISQYLSQLLAKGVISKETDAIISKSISLTYEQLEDLSTRLAKVIRHCLGTWSTNNADGDIIIAFCIRPSEQMIVLILAILKLGAAFLPVLIDYPEEHLVRILGGSRPILILTDSIKAVGARFKCVQNLCKIVNLEKLYSVVERGAFMEEQEEVSPLKSLLKPYERIAAVYFTSGLIGHSQGVRVTQQCILNHVLWLSETLPFQPKEVCGIVSNISDIESLGQIFTPLLKGIPIFMCDESISKTPEKLSEKIEMFKMSRITLTPAQLADFISYLETKSHKELTRHLDTLRYVFSCGDSMTYDLGHSFFKVIRLSKPEQLALVNLFGTTETMKACCYDIFRSNKDLQDKQLEIDHTTIPVGLPVYNTRIYIANEVMKLVRFGISGEICISGACLCDNYVSGVNNNTGFIMKNSWLRSKESKLFRSGDLGRISYDNKGNKRVYHVGRKEDLVKIRGRQLDLTEIASDIRKTELVEECEVLCYRQNREDQLILAACILKPGVEGHEINDKLTKAARYPRYMLPEVYSVSELPRFPSGRLNKQRILHIYESRRMEARPEEWQALELSGDSAIAARVLFQGIAISTGVSVRYVLNNCRGPFWAMGGSSLNAAYVVVYCRTNGYTIILDDFVKAESIFDVIEVMLKSRLNPGMDVNLCRYAFNAYEITPFINSNSEEATDILIYCYPEKSDFMLHLKNSGGSFAQYLNRVVQHYLRENLSVVAWDKDSRRMVAVCLATDLNRLPKVKKTDPVLNYYFELIYLCEASVREKVLSRGQGKTVYVQWIGTSEDVSQADNVLLIQLLVKSIAQRALSKGYTSLMISSPNLLVKQLFGQLLGYSILNEYRINQFVARDGSRPFQMVGDYYTMRVYYKDIF